MCLCALAWCKIPRIVWASSINTIRASGIPQIDIPAKEAILRNTPYELGDTASDHHHKHHTPRHPAARRRRVRRRLGRRRPATGHHGAAPRHHRHRCHQYGRKTRTNVNNALNNYRVAHRSGETKPGPTKPQLGYLAHWRRLSSGDLQRARNGGAKKCHRGRHDDSDRGGE